MHTQSSAATPLLDEMVADMTSKITVHASDKYVRVNERPRALLGREMFIGKYSLIVGWCVVSDELSQRDYRLQKAHIKPQ